MTHGGLQIDANNLFENNNHMSGNWVEIDTDLFEQRGCIALNASWNATSVNHEGVSVFYADLNMDSDDFFNTSDGQLTADTMTLNVANTLIIVLVGKWC